MILRVSDFFLRGFKLKLSFFCSTGFSEMAGLSRLLSVSSPKDGGSIGNESSDFTLDDGLFLVKLFASSLGAGPSVGSLFNAARGGITKGASFEIFSPKEGGSIVDEETEDIFCCRGGSLCSLATTVEVDLEVLVDAVPID